MKNPLTEWKHWLTWTVLASAVAGVTYYFTHNSFSILVFFSWLISIAILDTIMHYAGWQ